MNEINIITGNLGCGKTEFSINYAIKEALHGKRIAIIDLDIVNPYFCTRDYIDKLKKYNNITVIAPDSKYSNAELMLINHEAISYLNSNFDSIIIDVGGDSDGAKALIQLKRFIVDKVYRMYFVLNSARPETKTYIKASKCIKAIEECCGLRITDIISNTHYGEFTDIDDIIYGDNEAFLLSNKLKLNYAYVTCKKELEKNLIGKVRGDIFILDKQVKFPWD